MREPEIHLEVLERFVENAREAGFAVQDVTFSPIKGPEGNIEFLGYLAKRGVESVPDLKEVVRQAHAELDGRYDHEKFFHLSQYAQGGGRTSCCPRFVDSSGATAST